MSCTARDVDQGVAHGLLVLLRHRVLLGLEDRRGAAARVGAPRVASLDQCTGGILFQPEQVLYVKYGTTLYGSSTLIHSNSFTRNCVYISQRRCYSFDLPG